MKKITASVSLFIVFTSVILAQSTRSFADSIRIAYHIPELAYAAVSADSIIELEALGVKRINTRYTANINDRFHIGSNTKAITSFIAALLVQEEKIKWETKMLDLFPEWKATARKAYWHITLQDLLSFRGKLPPYTYYYDQPTQTDITGDNARQRYLLAKYFLSQPPMKPVNDLTPSNADYVIAGLMLEKVSGKTYKELVHDLGKKLDIDFQFDFPNLADSLQPWGHDKDLKPLPPFDNYKLNWLLSAGNINVNLPDYIKFAQLQLKGLKGQTSILPAQIFKHLLFGLPVFSFGWFSTVDPGTHHHIAVNEGNAGAYITRVHIVKETDRAYIIFTNAFTEHTSAGITVLMDALEAKYGK